MDFFFESINDPVRANAGVMKSAGATPRPRSRALRSACARSAVAHRCVGVTGAWRDMTIVTYAIAQSVLRASIIVAVLLLPHAGNV